MNRKKVHMFNLRPLPIYVPIMYSPHRSQLSPLTACEMSFCRFATLILVLILLCFGEVNNSLLSRSKNPNEYLVAPRDWSMSLDELDDQTYEYLLEEVPELRQIPRNYRRRQQAQLDGDGMSFQMPYLKKSQMPRQEMIEEDAEYGYTTEYGQEVTPYNVTSSAEPSTGSAPPSSTARTNSSRRILAFKNYWKVGTCFACGMHSSHKLPDSPLCHDAFQSPDWRFRTLARYFRARCFRNDGTWSRVRAEPKRYMSTNYHSDQGLIRGYYGNYRGGCYKRFLDVGRTYTQRGCRSWWPRYGVRNFATHRYTRLEALLKKEKDKCIISPGASLTPFSRSISLFARYHVCVCEKRYCNAAAPLTPRLLVATWPYLVLLRYVYLSQ